jgi:predicted nucleic acid-binding protein
VTLRSESRVAVAGEVVVLVDTSVWIDVIRGRLALADHVGEEEEIAICLPVYHELLRGVREERDFRRLRERLLQLPMLSSAQPLEIFDSASQIYRAGRVRGVTIRSTSDLLVAATAIRHAAELLHRDSDFTRIAGFTPLRERAV